MDSPFLKSFRRMSPGKSILILVIVFVLPLVAAGEIYRWVNDDGTIGFTDDPAKIPAKYKDKIKVEKEKSEAGKEAASDAAKKKLEDAPRKNPLPLGKEPPAIGKEPPEISKLSPEERKKMEEETRATWEKMRKSLQGK